MFDSVDTNLPSAVEAEVLSAYMELFPGGMPGVIRDAFDWAVACFEGRRDGFQAIDSLYHDFGHTLQGTLCLARLLRGRHLANARPALLQRTFELAIIAILFHDTGYLKASGDTAGTGAKYTTSHVSRSGDFADRFLTAKGWSRNDTAAVRHMIRCTGVNVSLAGIPFQNEEEKIAGFALATADLLGQMAAEDYIDRLPDLYLEFEEAAEFDGDKAPSSIRFESLDQMKSKTPAFWESYVLPKIKNEFGGIFEYLRDPFPSGRNIYLDRIEANIARLR